MGDNVLNSYDFTDTKRSLQAETGLNGGEGGIRTRDTLLTYTHFPGVRLRPLGHLSIKSVKS